MRKYLLLVIAVLSVMIVSGCVSQQDKNQTKSYNQNNISFNYPGAWALANATAPDAIVAVADPSTVIANTNSPTTQVVIQKSQLPKNSDLRTAYVDNYAKFFNNTGNFKVSEANITTSKLKAYENVYTSTAGGVEKQYRAVWLQKNGIIYIILCSARKDAFQSQQGNFDLIINSFQA